MAALGRGLAALHASGASSSARHGRASSAGSPLDNTPAASWPTFYAEQRVRPYLRLAVDAERIDPAATLGPWSGRSTGLAELAGPPEPPARLHGDLWAGNVIFGRHGQAYLIDPAAHGGHRETDLAMLALFGAPHLDVLLAAYDEVTLARYRAGATGSACTNCTRCSCTPRLFGGGYGRQAGAAARRYG